MPATPKYALPYPAPTEPADVPTDMQELAVAVEAALGSQFAGGAVVGDVPVWNGTTYAPKKLTNAEIAAAAAIIKSKLAALAIVDADVLGPIAASKIAGLDAMVRPPYGTSLPGSPADGQEAILVDSTANPKYAWRFRWNAGSASPYKWEFIGGSALTISDVTKVQLTAPLDVAYTDLGGPTLTVPRAGEYDVAVQAQMSAGGNSGGANLSSLMSYSIGGAAAADGDSVISRWGGSDVLDVQSHEYRFNRKTLAAGTTLKALYRHTGNSDAWPPEFQHRALAITPLRVS